MKNLYFFKRLSTFNILVKKLFWMKRAYVSSIVSIIFMSLVIIRFT